MEIIIEFLLELILEGSIAVYEEKKVSKWIRYPALIIVAIFSIGFIIFMFFLSLEIMNENKYGGYLTFAITFFLIGCIVYRVRKVYKENYKKNDKGYD